jgi:hypothetical protein
MGGNVICSRCWANWIADGTDWRSKAVTVVTIVNGNALCEKHYVEVLGIVPGHAAPAGVGG